MKLIVIMAIALAGVAGDISVFNSYSPPEIISNGYHYPVPDPPVQFDEPELPGGLYGVPVRPNASFPPFQDELPPLIPTYLPPNLYPPLTTPGVDIQPPQFDPLPTDDTVIISPPNHYLPPSYGVPRQFNSVQMKLVNMSCLDTLSKRFFRAMFQTMQFLQVVPVVENDEPHSNCISGAGDRFRIELEGSMMRKCGVKYCNSGDKVNMCVTLRMPTVKGLKLPEDYLVTLQCRPQDSVVSHTKQFKINSINNVQGRSASTVASGGSQRSFETQVGLFRRVPGTTEFTQIVAPGTAISLGEDLLLRATVREGDGWKFSRMGTVAVHRIGSQGELAKTSQNSVILVDSQGCRNPSMRGVCPEQPRQVTPLITTLPFRAFMFQESKSGDEMVLSVRMIGCLQFQDCHQVKCEDALLGRSRTRRNVNKSTMKNNVTDWQSYVEFKVVLPQFQDQDVTRASNDFPGWHAGYTAAIFGGTATLLFIAIFMVIASRR